MYHNGMTIKRRLFISNIRMVIISMVAFALTGRIVGFIVFGSGRPNREIMETLRDASSRDMRMIVGFLGFALFIILISIISNILTHRMTRRIVKPLEPLSEGVRQIHDNNLTYRIDYQGNDEFRPVCDAFNEMAAKLESSTVRRKKDEANRRELIVGISHDLRTPLTSIKGYIEGIETGVAATAEMRDNYLAIIKNKAAVMEHIIEQLFLFSKLDMDEFPLNLKMLDIGLAVSDMVEDFIPEYEAQGLSIRLAKMPENAIVCADVLLLRNVIMNLLENSVKYKIKEQGQMEVSAEVINNSVLLRFADDGPGVPADMLPKLFDIFYRTDPSRSTKGSGLGLAICAKIIERMDGSIHADLPDGGGLAFIIRLPLSQGEG